MAPCYHTGRYYRCRKCDAKCCKLCKATGNCHGEGRVMDMEGDQHTARDDPGNRI